MYGDDLLKVKVLGFLGFEVEVWHGDENNDSVGLCVWVPLNLIDFWMDVCVIMMWLSWLVLCWSYAWFAEF